MDLDFVPHTLKFARDIAAARPDVESAVIRFPWCEQDLQDCIRREPMLEVTIAPHADAARVKADIVTCGLHCVGSGWVNMGPILTFVFR